MSQSEWSLDNVEIDEIEDLKMRLRKANLPPDVRKQAQRLARLKRLAEKLFLSLVFEKRFW